MNDNNKEINDPQVWMYVASCLNPVFTIAFVIIYVIKNKFRKIFEIWIVTLLIHVLILLLAIIIDAVAFKKSFTEAFIK